MVLDALILAITVTTEVGRAAMAFAASGFAAYPKATELAKQGATRIFGNQSALIT
jgi:hypothetical protein